MLLEQGESLVVQNILLFVFRLAHRKHQDTLDEGDDAPESTSYCGKENGDNSARRLSTIEIVNTEVSEEYRQNTGNSFVLTGG